MEKKLQISKLVAAHRKWRKRLEQAIEIGSSEFKPSIVRLDNQCEFGKWLHSEVSAELAQTAEFQQIKQLHGAFHQEAGRILEIALQGQKTEAQRLLSSQGNFAKISEGLVAKLTGWHFGNQNQETLTRSNGQDQLGTILEERARALAQVAETQTGESISLVVFTLANETYGIATEYVREVQPLRDVTPVPCTPDFVAGVINIRGSIYSVIDIRSFFDVPKREIGDSTKVILVSAAGLEIGILADDVKGATSILLSDIKPALAAHGVAKEEYIQGVTKEMLTILNLEPLLRDERIIIHEEA
jgi:purine-binding chemotaxis protein CheW